MLTVIGPVCTLVDLLADRTRALPVNDPEDRELTISCGCALFNLRVAAAAAGHLPTTLGARVLRADTAPLAALAVIAALESPA